MTYGPRLVLVIAALLVVVAFGWGEATPAAATPGIWSAAGSLTTARYSHTETLLPNGKVLVVGGRNGLPSIASAELYDPNASSNPWSVTNGLDTSRSMHTATLLNTGKVLVVGGAGPNGTVHGDALLYDPNASSNPWSSAASPITARYLHTATLLANGKVLVVGGAGPNTGDVVGTAQLYDPIGDSWSSAGSLLTARYNHTATLLPSGKVLITGGQISNYAPDSLASSELYDPNAPSGSSWSLAGNMTSARYWHTASLLPNGRVLVAGGYDGGGCGCSLASAEIYNPSAPPASAWSVAASPPPVRLHTATLLANGLLLVAGGYGTGGSLSAAELYDPSADVWSPTGGLSTARDQHTVTLLPSGKALVVGGYNGNGEVASAELYDAAQAWKVPYAPNVGVVWTGGPHALLAGGDLTASFPTDCTVLVSDTKCAGSGMDFSGGSFNVEAIADGTVEAARCDSEWLGCFIAVRHGVGGPVSVYAHLATTEPGGSAVSHQCGSGSTAQVCRGDKIAVAGSSGRGACDVPQGATADLCTHRVLHLHLELRQGIGPDGTNSTCSGAHSHTVGNFHSDCFGEALDWDGIVIDGWHIHEYFSDASRTTAYNYDGSAMKGATKVVASFRYIDDVYGLRTVVGTVDSSFTCPVNVLLSCEPNPQTAGSATQFAGGGMLGAGGGAGAPIASPSLDGAGQSSGELTSTNLPPAPPSVGGIAEQPDLAAFRSSSSSASASQSMVYSFMGVSALLVVGVVAGWVAWRRRHVA